MITTWFITVVVLVVVLGLITFLVSQKDKKQVTKDFSAEFPDPEFINEELNDER